MTDDDTPVDLPPETDDDSEDEDIERAALEAAGIDVSASRARARGPGRPNAILEALEHLGPSSATEVAKVIGRATPNVSTRLRQMEEQDRVHRTGKSVNPGSRGGPQVEWAVGPSPNGTRTDPTTQVEQPTERGSFEARLRAMAEKIAHANGRLEAVEHERDGAAERAKRSEAAQREAEKQRDEARERIVGLQRTLREVEERPAPEADTSELEEALEAEKDTTRELVEKVEALERQRSDLEEHVERLRMDLDAQAEDAGVAASESNSMAQSELDDLAGLLALPNADDHGAVRDRVRELLTARPRSALEAAGEQALELWRDTGELLGMREESAGRIYERIGRMQQELERAQRELVAPAPDVGLRLRYFEALMELARETRDEHVFDRIERLLEGGGPDA